MNTETFPQETIDLMRRPEHALWMSRLAQRIHDKKDIANVQLPECLHGAVSENGEKEALLKALAQAACAGDDPRTIAGNFEARMPQPVLSEAAREWLDQPENADEIAQLLSWWDLNSFAETDEEYSRRHFDNPFTQSFPQHWTITPRYAGEPPRWRIRPADTASLLGQYAGISFETAEQAKAFRHVTTNPSTKTLMQRWAVYPGNRAEVRKLVSRLGNDGHTVYRPNIDTFAPIPEEALADVTRVHPGIGSEEPGVHGLELLKKLAEAFDIHTGKTGRGFAMRDLNEQMTKLLNLLDEADAKAGSR